MHLADLHLKALGNVDSSENKKQTLNKEARRLQLLAKLAPTLTFDAAGTSTTQHTLAASTEDNDDEDSYDMFTNTTDVEEDVTGAQAENDTLTPKPKKTKVKKSKKGTYSIAAVDGPKAPKNKTLLTTTKSGGEKSILSKISKLKLARLRNKHAKQAQKMEHKEATKAKKRQHEDEPPYYYDDWSAYGYYNSRQEWVTYAWNQQTWPDAAPTRTPKRIRITEEFIPNNRLRNWTVVMRRNFKEKVIEETMRPWILTRDHADEVTKSCRISLPPVH